MHWHCIEALQQCHEATTNWNPGKILLRRSRTTGSLAAPFVLSRRTSARYCPCEVICRCVHVFEFGTYFNHRKQPKIQERHLSPQTIHTKEDGGPHAGVFRHALYLWLLVFLAFASPLDLRQCGARGATTQKPHGFSYDFGLLHQRSLINSDGCNVDEPRKHKSLPVP